MKHLVLAVFGVTITATLATAVLWLTGYQVAASLVFSLTIFSWLALFGLASLALGSWYSAKLMRDGADLVLRAQDSNDRWDAQKTASFAALARTMFSLTHPSRTPQQPLPPLLEAGSFLPDVDVVGGRVLREEKAKSHD